MTANAEHVRQALRRHYGLTASDLVTEEWTVHDEVPLTRRIGVGHGDLVDVLCIRAWAGKPKGHERHGIEIKVSRSDFLRELKARKWEGWLPFVHRFYFAAPAGLLRLDEIPDGCGLYVVDDSGVRCPREAASRSDAEPLPEATWIDLARRASRLAERFRRAADDPVAELAALKVSHERATAVIAQHDGQRRRWAEKMTALLRGIRLGDVVCSSCGEALHFGRPPRRFGAGGWAWLHEDPDRYCYPGDPIPRDLLDSPATAEEAI
jgi:hypothetical protein